MESDIRSEYGSTVPNTPEPASTEDFTFARLIPLNSHAADAIPDNPTGRISNHHAQFIDACDFEGSRQSCYIISLSTLPKQARFGWSIGRGRAKIQDLGVDFLMTPSRSVAADIAGVHARLHWKKGAAGFFISASLRDGPYVRLNGESLRMGASKVVPQDNTIAIGECWFTLQFVKRDIREQTMFDKELLAFMQACGDENPYILPTPRDNDYSFGDWSLHGVISRGGSSTIYYVTHTRDGTPAAAKQLLKTGRDDGMFEAELAMSTVLCDLKHPNVNSPIEVRRQQTRLEIDKSRLDALLGEFRRPSFQDVLEEWILISPLATTTLAHVCDCPSNFDTDVVIELYLQSMQGVDFLHERGISHGDIKPHNILVFSLRRGFERAAITDFGCASTQEEMDCPKVATVHYMAPEQVAGRRHTKKADLWAMGIVAKQLNNAKHKERLWPDSAEYKQLMRMAKECQGQYPLVDCCAGLLQERPGDRMTPTEAIRRLKMHIPEIPASSIRPGSKRRVGREVVKGLAREEPVR